MLACPAVIARIVHSFGWCHLAAVLKTSCRLGQLVESFVQHCKQPCVTWHRRHGKQKGLIWWWWAAQSSLSSSSLPAHYIVLSLTSLYHWAGVGSCSLQLHTKAQHA